MTYEASDLGVVKIKLEGQSAFRAPFYADVNRAVVGPYATTISCTRSSICI